MSSDINNNEHDHEHGHDEEHDHDRKNASGGRVGCYYKHYKCALVSDQAE